MEASEQMLEISTQTKNPSTGLEARFGPLLSPSDLLQILNCSKAHANRLKARVDFPRPIVLGERTRRWRATEVEAWIDSQREVAV